ncbi:MAG TPA: hypothetical protein VHA06_12695, partial [Candidatus Angelobacter sp.]|nr:hypothetical protein [Candidatus Angelobacter sp.]
MKKFWENPANNIAVPQGVQVPESLQIRDVRIAPATVLAPMAGVTDTVFRRFIRNASFVRSAGEVMAAPEEGDDRLAAEVSQALNLNGQMNDGAEPNPPEVSKTAVSNTAISSTKEISGCGLLMTEFTSADGLFRTRESKRKRYLTFYE